MDIYNIKWAVLLAIALITSSIYIWRKYHWSAGLLFGYTTINTLAVAIFPHNIYSKQLPSHVVNMLSGNAAKALICILLVVFLADRIKKMHWFLYFFLGVQILNAIYVICQYSLPFVERVGFFDNISLNGGLIGLAAPIILKTPTKKLIKISTILLFTIAIALSKASIPFGVMGLSLAAYFFMQSKKLFVPFTIFITLIGAASFYDGDLPFYQKSRFDLYKIQTNAFLKDKVCYNKTCLSNGNVFTGYGQGTFPFWAFVNQINHYTTKGRGEKGELIIFLHSDWLQIMLENGLIGLALSLIMFFYLVIMSWGKPLMFSLLMGYAGFMVYGYPLHYPFHALIGMCIISYIMLSYKGDNSIIMEERGAYGQTLFI